MIVYANLILNIESICNIFQVGNYHIINPKTPKIWINIEIRIVIYKLIKISQKLGVEPMVS